MPHNYSNIREEELKNKIASDYFSDFDTTKIIGNVDFCVSEKNIYLNPLKETPNFLTKVDPSRGVIGLEVDSSSFKGRSGEMFRSLLWAEAKKGKSNIYHSFVQLILTIGKARTFDKELPPAYLGAFDSYQIAFIPYNEIQEIFYQNDFNWNVTPSNYETKEFKQIYEMVVEGLTNNSSLKNVPLATLKETPKIKDFDSLETPNFLTKVDPSRGVIDEIDIAPFKGLAAKQTGVFHNTLIFNYQTDDKELREFIKTNFVVGKSETSKIQIDKNNFIIIYNKWLAAVKPSIIVNWDTAKKHGIIDGDFYLADLLSEQNQSLKENLYVLLRGDHYELDKKLDDMGFFSSKRSNFNDNQKAHNQFWNRYQRPPRQEYWDYIVERRDLLVPQDVRERKGSFFTPQIWVEKSQEYLTDVLGENWQDEYYIWDCAAGTGNLLTGLINKYNIYASTLDKQDVDVMKDRIKNGANLLETHVFQFDFLNDSFEDEKVPQSLREILNNPEKRKKLVIYINPPYAENGSGAGKGARKSGVSNDNLMYKKYTEDLGRGSRELFAQFFLRIYNEISGCYLSSYSTLKHINSQNFVKFRGYFLAEFKKGFVAPADTFDNVKGQFPIGFLIWDTDKKEEIKNAEIDVFDTKNNFLQKKTFSSYQKGRFIIDWLREFYDKKGERIAYLRMQGTDMQNNKGCFFTDTPSKNDVVKHLTANITQKNLIPMSIYLAVRHCIKATWLNDRDQFLFPNENWKTDTEFQNDCLAFSLFHGQNRISSKTNPQNPSDLDPLKGVMRVVNHWIPFTENQVNAPERFDSHFMTEFMSGKLKQDIVEEGLSFHDNDDNGDTEVLQNGDIKSPLQVGKQNGDTVVAPTQDEIFISTQDVFIPNKPLEFSPEAQTVFSAGRELWRYYFEKISKNNQFVAKTTVFSNGDKNTRVLENGDTEVASTLGNFKSSNPSLYDIKAYFQGVDENGRMNNQSQDEKYNSLIGNLRESLEVLSLKIQPKVYEYGFLKK